MDPNTNNATTTAVAASSSSTNLNRSELQQNTSEDNTGGTIPRGTDRAGGDTPRAILNLPASQDVTDTASSNIARVPLGESRVASPNCVASTDPPVANTTAPCPHDVEEALGTIPMAEDAAANPTILDVAASEEPTRNDTTSETSSGSTNKTDSGNCSKAEAIRQADDAKEQTKTLPMAKGYRYAVGIGLSSPGAKDGVMPASGTNITVLVPMAMDPNPEEANQCQNEEHQQNGMAAGVEYHETEIEDAPQTLQVQRSLPGAYAVVSAFAAEAEQQIQTEEDVHDEEYLQPITGAVQTPWDITGRSHMSDFSTGFDESDSTVDNVHFNNARQQQRDMTSASMQWTAYSTDLESNISIGLVEANPVSEQFRPSDLQQAEMVNHTVLEEPRIKKGQTPGILCFGGFTLACIVLALVLGLSHHNSSNAATLTPSPAPSVAQSSEFPSSAPSGALDFLMQELPNSTKAQLEDISTPQWKGMDWLLNHPQLGEMEEWRKTQLFVLAVFFYAFEGPNWRPEIRERWLLYDKPECLWFSGAYGKFEGDGPDPSIWTIKDNLDWDPCDDQDRMISIVLDDLDLAGFHPTIPPEITLLTSLSYLALRRNGFSADISDWIPPYVYEMPNLTFLALNSNEELTGQIPTELAALTNLQELLLDDCSLSGTLPTELGQLANVQKLDLRRNKKIEGQIPSELGLMTSMTKLSVNQNKFSGTLPMEITHVKRLEYLQLAKNKLTGTIPSQLSILKKLTDLRAQKNNFSGAIPSELGLLTSLTRLNFGGNDLEGQIPSEIGVLKSMKHLYLSDASLSGPIPSEIGLLVVIERFNSEYNSHSFLPPQFWELTSMKRMRLSGNQFDGILSSEIGRMTDLEEFYGLDSGFTGALPSELGRLTGMKWLLLQQNQFSGSIPTELSALVMKGSLETLNLGGNMLSGVVPEALCALGQYSSTAEEPHGLQFDCSNLLCGCDWCSCT